ncbi:glycosyltransferase [Cohnella sp. GCM10012308]|uniref:glycosyltransferase n=1 Tax=Cohnella sp. GCM10012308 TaxID=3317329 RepID=UPI00360A4E4D
MKPVSIVLLAQHASLTKECLEAIATRTRLPYELIVVNDGAQPEISALAAEAGEKGAARELKTGYRAGVAAGFNLGAAEADGEYIVFLRDSATVSPDWLEPLVDCLAADPKAALAGPLSHGVSGAQHAAVDPAIMLTLDRSGRAALAGRGGGYRRTSRLLSFSLAARKSVFDKLGGFDERFALESYEDDDLCYRALTAGCSLYIAQDSFVRYTPPPPLFEGDPDRTSRQLALNRQAGIDKWGSDLTDLLYAWQSAVTVSLCMIVKNEEETLERCLSSVADLVDEIVIVDTGSTDRTKEIAGQFTDRVRDFEWVDDFSKARNYAFGQATQEYILWLDADDVMLPADRNQFRALVAALPMGTDAVSMHYDLGRDAYGNVISSLRRNRLVRRSMGFRWIGVVHEYLEVYGQIWRSEVRITHDRVHANADRNLRLYERKEADGEAFGPRDTYYYANELFDHGHWERAAARYEAFLALGNTWIEDRIGACGRAAECYFHLGRLQHAREKALQSFSYALPRAENCCRLGLFYLSENQYKEAAWWYRMAAGLEMPADTSALLHHACWTWLPHLQLCVCYDRLGEYALAREENERAAAFLPDDDRIIANRAYLEGRLASV